MKWLFIIVGVITISVAGYFFVANDVFALAGFDQDQEVVYGEDADKKLDESRFDDPNYWKSRLTKEQFEVARLKGTERAFRNAYHDNKKNGVYRCICCNEPLFDSKEKFDSGTGWPSFYKPTEGETVESVEDRSHDMIRTEVKCAKCDAHLGHVFPWMNDRLRYCINSASLDFEELDADGNPVKSKKEELKPSETKETEGGAKDQESGSDNESETKMTGKKKKGQ